MLLYKKFVQNKNGTKGEESTIYDDKDSDITVSEKEFFINLHSLYFTVLYTSSTTLLAIPNKFIIKKYDYVDTFKTVYVLNQPIHNPNFPLLEFQTDLKNENGEPYFSYHSKGSIYDLSLTLKDAEQYEHCIVIKYINGY